MRPSRGVRTAESCLTLRNARETLALRFSEPKIQFVKRNRRFLRRRRNKRFYPFSRWRFAVCTPQRRVSGGRRGLPEVCAFSLTEDSEERRHLASASQSKGEVSRKASGPEAVL